MVASAGLSICLWKTLAKRTTLKLFQLQDRFLIIFVEPWPFGYYHQQVTMTPFFFVISKNKRQKLYNV